MLNTMDLPHTLQKQTILALNKLGRTVTSSLKLEDVLERIMLEVTDLLQPEGVAILMPEGADQLKFVAVHGSGAVRLKDVTMPRDDGVAGYVMRTGVAAWINGRESNIPGLAIYRDVEDVSEFHTQSLLAAPLLREGKAIGVLEAAHSRPEQLTIDSLPALAAAANWAAIAITNAQLHEQAQRLREQQASLEERARLARELHDVVTQSLYSMSVLAGAWRRQIESGRLEPDKEHIIELDELVQQALREVRLLVYELRPTELEEEGLLGALFRRLETVERRAGIEARLIVTDERDRVTPSRVDGRAATADFYHLPPVVELELFRVAQEALNNVLKHSGAKNVIVRLQLGEETLSMAIEDDGRGFDPDTDPEETGFGLLGLRERAEQLGGSARFESSPGAGTTIRIYDIPYRFPKAEEIIP